MDPPAAAAAGAEEKKGTKLRLMCSYGGQIVPRPHDKTLSYIGGETRLILSDRHVSLQDLTTRLSKTLLAGKPFSLKYQLPTEDLDSLISVTTAEDLDNMIDEYDRLLQSQQSGVNRIRLFLFTPDDCDRSFLRSDRKSSEEWFLNALNNGSLTDSASVNSLLGLVDKKHQDVVDTSVPDSPIMDTSSSFGSTSSSSQALAMANLPPIKVHVVTSPLPPQQVAASTAETAAVVRVPATLADMASPDSLSSESSLTNTLSRQRNMFNQDSSLQVQNQNPPSSRVTTPVDPKLSDSSPTTYVFPTQFEHFQQLNPHHHHHHQQQQAHYIQSGSQYIPQGAVQASAYYIVYPPQQQYPSTYVSARPAQQTYNIQSSYAPPSMGSSQNPQQFMGYPPIHHQSHQSIAPSGAATGNFSYEYTDPKKPESGLYPADGTSNGCSVSKHLSGFIGSIGSGPNREL